MQWPLNRACILTSYAMVLLAGCSGFKEVDKDKPDSAVTPGSDATSAFDGAPPTGGTGPGPWGALPTGYCCTGDEQCRYRRCVDSGGGRMCADECHSDDPCQGGLPGFHCVGASTGKAGLCLPQSAANTSCVPADQFKYGKKKLGGCCVATHDGRAGAECEGNHCGAFGELSNPFICTHVCAKAADCPGNYICTPVAHYSICAPLAKTYTCP